MSELVLEPVPEAELAGPMRPARHGQVYVLDRDGRWQKARVIAWARHRDGWAVRIRLAGAMTDSWRRYHPRGIHPALSAPGLSVRLQVTQARTLSQTREAGSSCTVSTRSPAASSWARSRSARR
jgi:hypothetical protein